MSLVRWPDALHDISPVYDSETCTWNLPEYATDEQRKAYKELKEKGKKAQESMVVVEEEIWDKENIERFIAKVAMPGEILQNNEDRMTYENAVIYANMEGENGKPLLDALKKLKTKAEKKQLLYA